VGQPGREHNLVQGVRLRTGTNDYMFLTVSDGAGHSRPAPSFSWLESIRFHLNNQLVDLDQAVSNFATFVVEWKRTDSMVPIYCVPEQAGLHSKQRDGHRSTVQASVP
jgi:hypothetical protein